MKIITRNLGIDFKTEAIGIYLSQILTDLDDTTKRLEKTERKWNIIKSILESVSVSSSKRPFNFLIFPEIAIPYTHIQELIGFIEQKFPGNTITILGIEIISVKDCKTLTKNLGIERKEVNRILQNADDEMRVNPCLIIVKSQKKKCLLSLQFKITHSKYQGDLDNIENLLPSDFMYYFKSKNLNFVTLICSDFFNRPSGLLTRIVDDIDYKILKKGLPLDFIINIQYNPSPDHELFLHSLNRIYDDGYTSHGYLCTVFLNSILSGIRRGGLSKVIFYKDLKLPEKQPLKQIDAPVVGYEFSEREMLIYLSFERLPKSWDTKRDVYPLHFECHEFVGNKWQISRTDNIRYIAPMEKETSFDFPTYEDLARSLSNLGKFDKSIEWAKKAQKHWEEQNDYLEAASMARFIAVQYRHQGIFRKALENYAWAEIFILKVEKKTPESMLTKWRIEAGKVMVEDYMIKGDCKKTDEEYNKLITEIDNYFIENRQIDDNFKKKIKLYQFHAKRMQAEIQRLLGNYNEALNLFCKVYKDYSYIYAEEKACSVLGQGDCLRMLGKLDAAMIKYKEVNEFVQEKRSSKLQIRVLRNMAELYRTDGQEIRNLLEELKELSNKTNTFFGKLYYLLIEGGLHLKEDLEKAEEFFRKANKLTQINEEPLKIEYAHSIFGLAEVKRLKKDTNAAEDYYNKAYKLYKETGILWGIIRTKIGIAMTNGSNSEQERLINLFKNSDHLIAKLSENKLKQDEILFLNIP